MISKLKEEGEKKTYPNKLSPYGEILNASQSINRPITSKNHTSPRARSFSSTNPCVDIVVSPRGGAEEGASHVLVLSGDWAGRGR